MKALQYLQKVGAVPDYNNWDLLMSLTVLCHELYSPDVMLEPDCMEWVQQSESDEEFSLKSDCVFYGTSGDVRVFFPHVCRQPAPFLKELIELLLETRLALYAIADGEEFNTEDEKWFTEEYNNRVGLKGKKRFPTKASILHNYFNGSLTEAGQEILAMMAGTKIEFTNKVAKLYSDFSNFLVGQMSGTIEESEFESEFGNPFEGGYEVKVSLSVPGIEDPQECTLHWAPWPTANTKSVYSEVRRICNLFNEEQKGKWLSEINGEE